jgi:hypothetical protein
MIIKGCKTFLLLGTRPRGFGNSCCADHELLHRLVEGADIRDDPEGRGYVISSVLPFGSLSKLPLQAKCESLSIEIRNKQLDGGHLCFPSAWGGWTKGANRTVHFAPLRWTRGADVVWDDKCGRWS